MQITYNFTKKDFIAAGKYIQRTSRSNKILYICLIILLTIIVFYSSLSDFDRDLLYICRQFFFTWIIAFAFIDLLVESSRGKYLRRNLPTHKPNGIIGEHTITLIKEGILEKTDLGEGKDSWEYVTRLTRKKKYIFIFVGGLQVYAIPVSAFDNRSHADEFFSTAQNYHRQAQQKIPPT